MPAKKMSVYLSLAPEKQVTRNVIQTEIVFPIPKDKKARSSMESLMLRIKEMISPRRKLTVRYNIQSKGIMLFSLSSFLLSSFFFIVGCTPSGSLPFTPFT